MIALKRCSLAAALGALSVVAGPAHAAVAPAVAPVTTVEAVQGTVVSWSVPGTKRCAMGGRSWAALQETCYYAIDMLHAPRLVRVSRTGVGPATFAHISVKASSYGTEDIALGDIPKRTLRRQTSSATRVIRHWSQRSGQGAKGQPGSRCLSARRSRPLPEAKGFGAKWVFNGRPDSSDIHSGVDYAVGSGTPVAAMADGTVVIAEDLFFTGKAVFIDHGNGLVGMYFHLSEIRVQAGQDVKKGEILGLTGSTGRVSGPHLHLGIRWHDARINPQTLLDDPAKIPSFGR